ncbi:hypothetical protein [Terriglobus sp. RCC_193]|uniref:hypothetical protein n=1 Tax=Terriglobus sp. RCC_193 TaxID=3239218 RepID=UPI003525EF06
MRCLTRDKLNFDGSAQQSIASTKERIRIGQRSPDPFFYGLMMHRFHVKRERSAEFIFAVLPHTWAKKAKEERKIHGKRIFWNAHCEMLSLFFQTIQLKPSTRSFTRIAAGKNPCFARGADFL